jgi:hypothetical protein
MRVVVGGGRACAMLDDLASKSFLAALWGGEGGGGVI